MSISGTNIIANLHIPITLNFVYMRKLKFVFFLLILALFLFESCKKKDPPVAKMSVQSTAYLFEEVVCISACENATSVTWDFGDGSAPSSETTVKHSYTSAGYYNIKLTAQNENGKDVFSQVLSVKNGKAEYNVTNHTSIEISFYAYGVNDNFETEEFRSLGPVKSGKTSGNEFTNQGNIFLAGSSGNLIFYSVYPCPITDFTLNELMMYDTTTVYIQGDKKNGIRHFGNKLHVRDILSSGNQK